MTQAQTIPFSSITLGERARSEYYGIEALAENIKEHGLIQPLVLNPDHSLSTGGRRYHALQLLGVTELYHGSTCDPERPGFVMKGESDSDPFKNLLHELAENLNRHDMPWQDEMRLVVKAYRLARSEHYSRGTGETFTQRMFASMLGGGINHADVQAACAIIQDVDEDPSYYKDVTSVRGAYSALLKKNADHLSKLAASRTLVSTQNVPKRIHEFAEGEERDEPHEAAPSRIVKLELHNTNGLDFMRELALKAPHSIDHIITDPDYGVALEQLEASVGGASLGVAQETIHDTLKELAEFLQLASHVLKPSGFCIFFYDLDHHEKLQTLAKMATLAVQRWPIIWHKTDYNSNASPQSNTTKNMEYAMVCRKPGATLAKHQPTSIFSLPTGNTAKVYGHPFAKPGDLWKKLFSMVATPGQTILDPFAGSGSCPVAAVEWGLTPVTCEINPDHYAKQVLNVTSTYERLVPNVQFA